MTTVFHARSYGRFIEIQSNLSRKKLHTSNQGSNFLGDSFSNRDKIIVKNSVTFSYFDFLGFFREKFGYLRVTLSNLNEIEDSVKAYQYK